uniref:NADP-dependent oxidoreductase domain-containing protein n=1 Tax=Haptolina ericina TaxID=156174 RepID=A0A7S3AVQ1_9EUKA|mmetsp:Transcript_3808/g.8285  ORF Transcript_3808/g.8285 Transcript_3808/m.8285 type:complete len:311 (+) Transcript_3808:161-1093(+)
MRRITALGAALSSATLLHSATLQQREERTRRKVQRLRLNTGAEMPALGFGTYLTGGDELRWALRCAIAVGYRHIDTAHGYQNEEIVGDAIAKSGLPRESFFITTKLWCSDHGTESTRAAIDASLRALGAPYIDCYLMHAPDNQGTSAVDIRELRRQSWLVMEESHRAGTLRAIGVSNFEPRHIEDLRRWGSVTPAVNQVELHAYLSQSELRDYCARHGIVLQSYGSVGADGLLDDPEIQAVAAAHGRTPAQVSLRHSLQRGCAVLAKSITPERIAQNFAIFDFELSSLDVRRLDALERGERTYWDNTDVP